MRRRSTAALAALSVLALAGCASGPPPAEEDAVDTGAPAPLASDPTEEVVGEPSILELGRDDAAEIVDREIDLFTQGLEFGPDGSLYHSGGRYGQSRVIRTGIDGEVLAEYELPDDEFAEGLTLVGEEVFLLTWRENIVRVLDADDLSEIRTLELGTEGWGACYDDMQSLVWVADGSATVRGYAPDTFEEVTAFDVVDDTGDLLHRLNELECIDGEVWANRWQLDEIVVVEPPVAAVPDDEGELPAVPIALTIALPEISPDADGRDAVLNGIAFDEENGMVWLTGKLWSEFFVFDYELLRGTPQP